MQKFQCLLFVLKRSYFCCYVILMTEPLIISTDTTINWLFHVFNFSSTKSWLTVKLSSKSLMTSFNCFIESEFTLISCERLFRVSLNMLLFFSIIFEIDFSCASYNWYFFYYSANISIKIFLICFFELSSFVVEINEMKWIRGIPCRCQFDKSSVWSGRIVIWCIKRK